MHLHGFYFDVDSLGNGLRDSPRDDRRTGAASSPSCCRPGGTMAMTWTPERAGNWLFHCHIMHHVSLDRRRPRPGRAPQPAMAPASMHGHAAATRRSGMAGMVLGVTVRDPAPSRRPARREPAPPRKLTLLMQRGPARRRRAARPASC